MTSNPEIETVTITDTYKTQHVDFISNLHLGNDINEVQVITLSETYNRQTIEVVYPVSNLTQVGTFKIGYGNSVSGCMPGEHTSIKFLVESAIQSIPQIQKVEVVDHYHEIVNGAEVHKIIIEFRTPTVSKPPFHIITDVETKEPLTFSECEIPNATGGMKNCSNVTVVLNRDPGLGYYKKGSYFQLAFDTSSIDVCPFCTEQMVTVTEPIDWAQGDMSKSTSLRSRLNALGNIANMSDNGTFGVQVSREIVPGTEGVTLHYFLGDFS